MVFGRVACLTYSCATSSASCCRTSPGPCPGSPGLFSSRGYNIESLSVSATDDPTVSRITLVTTGSEAVIQQIVNQLNKLIDVVAVDDMTSDDHLERELVLVKMRLPPDAARAGAGRWSPRPAAAC